MKQTAEQIIKAREFLNNEIHDMWNIIRTENVLDRGTTPRFDLEKVIVSIGTLSKRRIQNKLQSIAINMGMKDFSEFPEETIFHVIYELSEVVDMRKQLSRVPTLDADTKTKICQIQKKEIEIILANFYKREKELSDELTKKNKSQIEIANGNINAAGNTSASTPTATAPKENKGTKTQKNKRNI